MSDEAKPWDSEAEVPRLCAAARPCRFSDCAENRARATVRALEAERAKTSELRHLLARALTRLKGGHEPGITNDIEEALR